jgi:hypothetical protein
MKKQTAETSSKKPNLLATSDDPEKLLGIVNQWRVSFTVYELQISRKGPLLEISEKKHPDGTPLFIDFIQGINLIRQACRSRNIDSIPVYECWWYILDCIVQEYADQSYRVNVGTFDDLCRRTHVIIEELQDRLLREIDQPSPREKRSPQDIVSLDSERLLLTASGKSHDLTDLQVELFTKLIQANGAWVPGKRINSRTDQILKRLFRRHPTLKTLIESGRQGYRLNLMSV